MARLALTLLIFTFCLAACGGTPSTEQALATEETATRRNAEAPRTSLPSPTSIITNNNAPTPINLPATAQLPPTVAASVQNQSAPFQILMNGQGLSTGGSVSNGEFQVEGYCSILNSEYGVSEDGTDWYCTFQGQRALTLREIHFTEICQLTYDNPNAIAIQDGTSGPAAFRWRCYEFTNPPTPTPQRIPVLLDNGVGLSTGRTMHNGEFEVEAYCSAINPNFGVSEDGNFWYCTQNGQRVLTLGTAEFDDICFRTYRQVGAFAQQINNNEPAAYRWHCYAYSD